MRIATYYKKSKVLSLSIIFISIALASIYYYVDKGNQTKEFDGQKAFQFVEYQMNLGPRIPGSLAHQETVTWITSELEKYHWKVDIQETITNNIPIQNIIAKRGEGTQWAILGSHYDSREFADRDKTPAGRKQPVPGANDGASSVAVLMELARVIPKKTDTQIWLVFFDAEDISGNHIAVGSQYFVDQLQSKPDQVIVLDMIGDKDLNIYMEKNSDAELNRQIWGIAAEQGYSQFIPQYKYRILDDHIPFINAGIKAVDIIDIDYPYWHTTQDTIDKTSAASLKVVGDVVLLWIRSLQNTK